MWAVGVDIGKHMDPSAIIGVELVPEMIDPNLGDPRAQDAHYMRKPVKLINRYHVRYMERPDLGTDYGTLLSKVNAIMNTPELRGESRLIVDIGNVGDALWEEWNRQGLAPIGIRFTAGDRETVSPQGYNVPKIDMITRMMLVFARKRILFGSFDPERYPEYERLKRVIARELQNLRASYTARGHVQIEAPSGEHDDMVMALAMVLWWFERTYTPSRTEEGYVDERSHDTYDPLYD